MQFVSKHSFHADLPCKRLNTNESLSKVGKFQHLIIISDVVRLNPNVALEGKASQSRDHVSRGFSASPFVASYAIDGSFETSVTNGRGACAIAERAPPVWWQVDLLTVYEITKVAITGRKEHSK